MNAGKKLDWDLIKKDYISKQGDVVLKEFAENHGVKYSTLRSRKNREKWDEEITFVATRNATNKKSVATVDNKIKEKALKVVEKLEDAELTEKQRLFCLYYIQSYNATMAAIKAGYAKDGARVEGHRLKNNPKIAAEIRRLKGGMQQEVFINGMDILNKYIEIGFADMGDYADWGSVEVPIVNEFGPVKDSNGEIMTREISYLNLKDSDEVDGSLISEVSLGKDGAKVKLIDKMKALEKLELYFDLLPDNFKRQVEEEKLKIQKDRLQLEKEKAGSGKNDKPIEILIKRKGEDD